MTGDRQQVLSWLMSQQDGVLFDVSEHKEKRNNDQNAYYWKVVTEIAKANKISTARQHNFLMWRKPVFETNDGAPVIQSIIDTDESYKKALESTTFHLMPTGRIHEYNGKFYRDWFLLKGSHSLNKEEFSELLEEALSEAREMGVSIEQNI